MTEENLSYSNVLEQVEKNNQQELLIDTLRKACKKIAPVWPLESFVAVNPYMGLIDKNFKQVAFDLATAGGIQMTLPTSFYLQKIEEETITLEHISHVLKKKDSRLTAKDFVSLLKNNPQQYDDFTRIAIVADVANQLTDKDWGRFATSRISNWAASYFDKGQAIWVASSQEKGPFLAWKKEAEIDFTPKVAGLKKFKDAVQALPNEPLAAVQFALAKLDIPKEGLDVYLHALLLRLGGWSAYAAKLDWDSELYGAKDGILIEFLAVLISWEVLILDCVKNDALKKEWSKASKLLANESFTNAQREQLMCKLLLQEAFEMATQQALVNKFNGSDVSTKAITAQAKAQAIFCIDVRSEVYRRNLELVDSNIETLGFAGFFAFPIKYVPIGHKSGEAQCPVLLKTGPTILEEINGKKANERALKSRVINLQAQQVWKSFKSGAVTCFSFVSPIGMSYLPKLFTDSFGLTRPVQHPDKAGLSTKFINQKRISLTPALHNHETVGIPLVQQIQMAKNALNAMSLTDNFATFVLIVGHGSSMVNNPHATAYDCGACGGHTGEANAKVVAAILNNNEVREGLQKENVHVPASTIFLACLHDTTLDEITIFNEYDVPTHKKQELEELKKSLKLAGHAARTERAIKLTSNNKINVDQLMKTKSKDWSETRPEWGLAGCSAFVVAPRKRTLGIDFGGRSFLHSYKWENDKGFAILELIMTAPMVVTSWISLQYYASTVDNKFYGSGNKTLHNVTAGVGVLEGFSGDLRVGLPWQAIHDGLNYQHEPVKLNVVIEAPIEAMNSIIEKHKMVQDLCDNGWLHLLALNSEGKISHRYNGNLNWEKMM